jgi:glycerol-3-phosphate acyltransferase PlsX
MEKVMNIENPKVGLANIGVEEGKGNELAKEAYNLLKNSNINFIGNIEGRTIPLGEADVIVADGFVGNIILKVTEGVAIFLFKELKDIFYADTKSKLGALLLKPGLKELKSKTDYAEYGGAPLLGTKRPIIKAHGSSNAYAFKNAINQAIKFIEKDVIQTIERDIL